MKIKLTKRRDATEKGPMTVMIEHDGQKKLFSVDTGHTLDVSDEIGYIILGDKRFQGLFEQVQGTKAMAPKSYQNKSVDVAEHTKGA